MTTQLQGVTAGTARPLWKYGCAATALLIGAAWLAGCGDKNTSAAGPPPPLPVTVVQVEPKDVPLTGEWVGTLDGYVNAQIQPQASGYLIKQNYKEGATVSKGEVLLKSIPAHSKPRSIKLKASLRRPRARCNRQKLNSNLQRSM